MSNRSTDTKQTTVVKAEVQSPSSTQKRPVKSPSPSPLKSSPLFGWLFAGADMITAELDQAAGIVSKQIDKTQEVFQQMQTKGVEVEADLRRTFNPFMFVDAAQNLVKSTTVYTMLTSGEKHQRKTEQLDTLSAKVDLLVEQVALLAAKEAAEQASKKATATAKPKTATRAAKASSSTASKASSSTASKASSSTASKAASAKTSSEASAGTEAKKAATKRPAARKTTAKSTSSTSNYAK
ncbi:MAG: hypothetical protein CL600_00630 [Alteromonas sp.]|nr:hypothetical protein [Alteromonas sp.]